MSCVLCGGLIDGELFLKGLGPCEETRLWF